MTGGPWWHFNTHIHDISSGSVPISMVLLVLHVSRFYCTCYILVSLDINLWYYWLAMVAGVSIHDSKNIPGQKFVVLLVGGQCQ